MTAFSQITGAPVPELKGAERTRDVTRLRHELMWMLRDLTSCTLARVGVMLGGRDLKTVIQGIDRVQLHAAADPVYRARIRGLRDDLIARAAGTTTRPSTSQIIAAQAALDDPNLSHADLHALAGGAKHAKGGDAKLLPLAGHFPVDRVFENAVLVRLADHVA